MPSDHFRSHFSQEAQINLNPLPDWCILLFFPKTPILAHFNSKRVGRKKCPVSKFVYSIFQLNQHWIFKILVSTPHNMGGIHKRPLLMAFFFFYFFSSGYFSAIRGCPKVLKLFMRPSVTKRLWLHSLYTIIQLPPTLSFQKASFSIVILFG
jgi:hypothetical protein